jgi:predicted lipid-binding transport protein (Tim44 family)
VSNDIMGDSSFQFFDIIFFAMVAAFLVLRLRSVLGKRTGTENPERWRPRPPVAPRSDQPARPDNVTPLPPRNGAPPAELPAPVAATPATPLEAGVTQIKLADPSFDPRGFVVGAKQAFEMIVGAFAQGDSAALRPLLSDEVYDNFVSDIRRRQQAKQTLETTLVGIKSAEIIEAKMDGRSAVVTMKFVTEQINVTRDAAGQTVDGDPSHVMTVVDVWTFSRNTRSRDPNWQLVATATQN